MKKRLIPAGTVVDWIATLNEGQKKKVNKRNLLGADEKGGEVGGVHKIFNSRENEQLPVRRPEFLCCAVGLFLKWLKKLEHDQNHATIDQCYKPTSLYALRGSSNVKILTLANNSARKKMCISITFYYQTAAAAVAIDTTLTRFFLWPPNPHGFIVKYFGNEKALFRPFIAVLIHDAHLAIIQMRITF